MTNDEKLCKVHRQAYFIYGNYVVFDCIDNFFSDESFAGYTIQ